LSLQNDISIGRPYILTDSTPAGKAPMLELFLYLLRRGAIGTVIPECDFVAGIYIAGHVYNHHVSDKSTAGVAGTAVVNI
jgi:hypothetical protein